eukprot:scaffold16226_cov60-Phaeocystis_antarctica.AAC.4
MRWFSLFPRTVVALVLATTYNLNLGLRSPRLQGALQRCRTRSGCAGLNPGCSVWPCTASRFGRLRLRVVVSPWTAAVGRLRRSR